MSRIGLRPADAPPLPTGSVTFLFTDLEDSSAAWERHPENAKRALGYHDRAANELISAHHGVLIKHHGDGVKAVFPSPTGAVLAAVAMQEHFQRPDWDGVERMRVRIGLHCGDAEPHGDDYYGGVVNRAARITDAANGDQIAVSEPLMSSTSGELNAAIRFIDRGFAQLKGCGQERIFLLDADHLQLDERPLRAQPTLAGSALPHAGGRLIGRDAVVERTSELVRTNRLVSVVGLGGVGKTRLAVAAARESGGRFSEGVVYCPLGVIKAAAADPRGALLAAIAEAIGARRQPDSDLMESIVHFVEGREVLVVLDNCEHLKDDAAWVVGELLSVDGPTVLTTSREALGVPGELPVYLEPLEVDSDAVELLAERTRERNPEFEADQHHATLRRICERLDGIPLALELAAARLRILTPTQLLNGLEESFDVIGASQRTDGRGSLHATVSWSLDQLDEQRQRVLESLSVFSGGFTLHAVAAVLGIDDDIELLDDLTELLELSLIRSLPGQAGIRFEMYETIRQVGQERLTQRNACEGSAGLTEQLRTAHGLYYAAVAAGCGYELMTADEAEVWTRIDTESGNLRVAFDQLVRLERYDEAKDLVVGLAWFSTFSMRMEFFGWAQRLLDVPQLAESGELWAISALGQYLGANSKGYHSAKRSLALDPSDPTGLAQTTLASIGLNNTFDAELSDQATAAMIRGTHHPHLERKITGTCLRAFHLSMWGDDDEAIACAEDALAQAMTSGSASALSMAYWAQMMANLNGSWPTVEEAISQGLAMAESLSYDHIFGHLINGVVAHFAALRGEIPDAAATVLGEIQATMDRHYMVGASHLLGAASVVLSRAGRVDDGAMVLRSMIDNGHRPRQEVRYSIERSLGGRIEDTIEVGPGWSITEAGQRAIGLLTEVADSSV